MASRGREDNYENEDGNAIIGGEKSEKVDEFSKTK